MVKVRSFQGFVVKKDLAGNLISPPYDVLDTIEAKEMAKGNEVKLFIFSIFEIIIGVFFACKQTRN